MDLSKAFVERRSVREFKAKKVPWDYIIHIMDAALHAPKAGNLNNLKFVIVTDEDMKKRIAEHSNQPWIADADTILVVCSDETTLKASYDERGRLYAKQQAGAAIQNALLKITELGLASCWVGAYGDELIRNDLHIPQHIDVEALLPIGYEKASAKTKQSKKPALENVMYWDLWGISKKPAWGTEPVQRKKPRQKN